MITPSKSPFYVIEEFISPLKCEDVLDACDYNIPDMDRDGHYVKTSKTCESAEALIYSRLTAAIPAIEKHYDIRYRGTENMMFEWFPEGSKGQFQCENSEFLRGKWLRTRSRDLSAVLFLSDFQETTPFESDYEVYGGKLEFVQHQFGFNPQRGTLVVFPSDPHFINITTPVLAGDLHQVRIQIAARDPLLYNPKAFPGNYTTWFAPQN